MTDNPPFTSRFAFDAPGVEAESQEESTRSFGYLRGVRERAVMLELRLRGGSAVAISYALLDRISFDPSEGVRLRFPGGEALLRGHLLNAPVAPGVRFFDLLVRHRVTWVAESSRADALEEGDKLVVESITID